MARQIQQIQDDTVAFFERGREFRLQDKRRYSLAGLSRTEKQAFCDGWHYEEVALRTGETFDVPEQYRKDLVQL